MKIGILILDKMLGKSIRKEYYDGVSHLGSWIIEDSIKEEFPSYPIEYCSFANINNYDAVLYSVCSIESIYSLIHNMLSIGITAKDISPTFILGGAGILNVRTFEDFGDVFVFGRGEKTIIEILNQIENGRTKTEIEGNEFFHVRGEDITPKKIRQSDELYPKELNGYRELILGCRNLCYFCEYSFSRKHISNKGSFSLDSEEEDFKHVDIKKAYTTTGLDGYSERIRHAVNKKIANRDIIEKYIKADEQQFSNKVRVLKMFMICGYPTETEKDYDDFFQVLESLKKTIKNNYFSIHIQNTPFSPEPLTPMAWESANIDIDYRQKLKNELLRKYYGDHFFPMFTYGGISSYTLFRRLLINRGNKDDANLIRFLAYNRKFENIKNEKKIEWLRHNYKIERFCSEYEIGAPIASDYLSSYISSETIQKLARKCRQALKQSSDI